MTGHFYSNKVLCLKFHPGVISYVKNNKAFLTVNLGGVGNEAKLGWLQGVGLNPEKVPMELLQRKYPIKMFFRQRLHATFKHH